MAREVNDFEIKSAWGALKNVKNLGSGCFEVERARISSVASGPEPIFGMNSPH